MAFDTVYEGRIYYKGEVRTGCVCVTDGIIADVRKSVNQDTVDVGSRLILPGGVDPHVHMREPGFTNKEDFRTGTQAAAFGGTTFVGDMPNTIPPVVDLTSLRDKRSTVEGSAFVDFGLHVQLTEGICPDHDTSGTGLPDEPDSEMICDVLSVARSALGFKLFMSDTTAADPSDDIEGLVHAAIGANRPLMVHAEEPDLFEAVEVKSLADHDRSRPAASEIAAIEHLLNIATRYSIPEVQKLYDQARSRSDTRPDEPREDGPRSCSIVPQFRVHIAHLTSAMSIPLVQEVREYDITSEVTPHHLLLDVDSDLGAYGKVNPPLRRRSDSEALWRALIEDRIDTVGSDHAPHLPDEKEAEFAHAPSGMPGVETRIPLMLNYVDRGILPLDRFVSAISTRPAEIFGLNKGAIEEGRDADLMIVDLKEVTEIHGDDLHSKCGWTPFEGMDSIFPWMTVLRGEVIMKDGALMGDRIGSFLC